MRISDWSSDVCSSDLLPETDLPIVGRAYGERQPLSRAVSFARRLEVQCRVLLADAQRPRYLGIVLPARRQDQAFPLPLRQVHVGPEQTSLFKADTARRLERQRSYELGEQQLFVVDLALWRRKADRTRQLARLLERNRAAIGQAMADRVFHDLAVLAAEDRKSTRLNSSH